MPHQEHWSARLTDRVSSGQPQSQMQTSSSANVRDVSTLLGRYTCQRKNCRPSQSLGLSQSGASTWLAPCRERLVVTHTSLSPSINSPSGSKPNLSPRSQPLRPRNSSKTLWLDSVAQQDHHRQWHTVHWVRIQRLVRRARQKDLLHFCGAPTE